MRNYRVVTQANDIPSKEYLYGRYQKNEDAQNALALKLAHKALDIPEEMNVNAPHTTTVSGVGTKGLIGLALAAGLPAVALAGLLGASLFKSGAAVPTPPAVVKPMAYDAITEEQQPDGTWREIKREHLKP